MGDNASDEVLKQTPLYDAHVGAGAKLVLFAGYQMPVQYADGVLKEHNWTREHAGLFDVSHMGQARLVADDGRYETVAGALEALVPADILNLKPGFQRYSQLLNENGGIIDDLMISRPSETTATGTLNLVVNAARKGIDYDHIRDHLPGGVQLELPARELALIALQGPEAEIVLRAVGATTSEPLETFMQTSQGMIEGAACYLTRSGYTGEDGYEISVAADEVVKVWDALLADERCRPVGLGARDSLRLEAGLCLYGHDIDETTSPIEAGLTWSIQKRRRETGGFPGATRIQKEITEGPARKRVGIKPDGRAPAREGTEILDNAGNSIGNITSGGFGPTAGSPVAMGYVVAAHAQPGTPVGLMVRGNNLPATIVDMPFAPHRYKRKRA